jgi:pyruvate, water dikinase
VITFAEILKDRGYPGFDPVKHINAPWVSDQLSLFKPEDEARFWFKGFQWPRAYPLNFVWLEDGFAWGTQAAARNMPLPPSDGLAPRVAGIFVYGSDIPVTPWVEAAVPSESAPCCRLSCRIFRRSGTSAAMRS